MRETMNEISLKHLSFYMLSALNTWINDVYLYCENQWVCSSNNASTSQCFQHNVLSLVSLEVYRTVKNSLTCEYFSQLFHLKKKV